MNPNINHKKRFVFIHIPKTAGNSIKQALGLDRSVTLHKRPTKLCSKNIWEKYFTFTFVRHPIDRLISSYSYHAQETYNGNLNKKIKNLENLSLNEYFNRMNRVSHILITPQINHITHKYSNTDIDYIGKFENINKDFEYISSHLDINNKLPYLNKTEHKHINISNNNLERIVKFYEADFVTFDYNMDIDYIKEKYL